MAIKEAVNTLLQKHSAYDMLPISSKVIIFDTTLLVKKALSSLLQHQLQAAPLWDGNRQQYAGMLTVTDFIQLILYYYRSEDSIEEIDTLKIKRLKEIEASMKVLPVRNISIHPDENICLASKVLLMNSLHRLPLVDGSSDGGDIIVAVITQYKILKFIAANCEVACTYDETPRNLGIGTYSGIATIKHSTPLADVLNIFIDRRLSSLPIVDDNNQVLDVCEKYDILALARDGTYYDLEMPISQALAKRSDDFEGIHTCTVDDSLGDIFQTIKNQIVHRFIVVDKKGKQPEGSSLLINGVGKLVGVIGLSDILKFFILGKE